MTERPSICWSKALIDRVCALYEWGYPPARIAKYVHLKRPSVCLIVHRQGLTNKRPEWDEEWV